MIVIIICTLAVIRIVIIIIALAVIMIVIIIISINHDCHYHY